MAETPCVIHVIGWTIADAINYYGGRWTDVLLTCKALEEHLLSTLRSTFVFFFSFSLLLLLLFVFAAVNFLGQEENSVSEAGFVKKRCLETDFTRSRQKNLIFPALSAIFS